MRNNHLLDYAAGAPLQLPPAPAYHAAPSAPQWGRLPGGEGGDAAAALPDVRALLASVAKEAIDVELTDEEEEEGEAGSLLGLAPLAAVAPLAAAADDGASGSEEECGSEYESEEDEEESEGEQGHAKRKRREACGSSGGDVSHRRCCVRCRPAALPTGGTAAAAG